MTVYPNSLNPLESDNHRLDCAVGIELHPVDANFAMVAISGIERTAVINDVIIIGSRQVHNGMMAGTSGDFRVLLQYLAYPDERPGGFIRYGISNAVIGTGPAAF